MQTYPVEVVRGRAEEFLLNLGISRDDASDVVDVLLEAELRGFETHGIRRLLQLQEGIEGGLIKPQEEASLVKEEGNTAIFDGNSCVGHPAAIDVMEDCIAAAQEYGIAFAGLRNAGHIGMAGYYSEIAAHKGLVGITMTASSPAVTYPGGNEKITGTNPLAFSAPYNPHPVTIDMATSEVSRGTVVQYKEDGKELPEPAGVAPDGEKTANPSDILDGGILPPGGGVKGALLNLLVTLLTGPAIGAATGQQIGGTRYMEEGPNKGDVFLAIDINSLSEKADYMEQMEYLMELVEKKGGTVHTPGKESYQTKKSRQKEGIPLSTEIKQALRIGGDK